MLGSRYLFLPAPSKNGLAPGYWLVFINFFYRLWIPLERLPDFWLLVPIIFLNGWSRDLWRQKFKRPSPINQSIKMWVSIHLAKETTSIKLLTDLVYEHYEASNAIEGHIRSFYVKKSFNRYIFRLKCNFIKWYNFLCG